MNAFRELPRGLKIVVLAMVVVFLAAAASVPLAIFTGIGDDKAGGGGDERTLERILSAGSDTGIQVTLGRLSDDYPSAAPRYTNGKVIATVRTLSTDGLGFIALYETEEEPSKALEVFERAFAGRDWSISSISRSDEGAAIQFQRTDGTMDGAVTIAHFGRDQAPDQPWEIAMSIVDRTRGESLDTKDLPFDSSKSQPLPQGYPANRVPVYQGGTVIASGFFNQQNQKSWVVHVVTKDSQEQVTQFYQNRLQAAGWKVDPPVTDASSIEVDFTDPTNTVAGGTIRSQVFLRQTTMTEVVIRFTTQS